MENTVRRRRGPVLGLCLLAMATALPLRPAMAEEEGLARRFRLIWGSKEENEDAEAKRKAGFIECPALVFDGCGAELRAPANADAASVRYQIKISDKAVECKLDGDKIVIRVGVAGAALLGPAGRPGAYYGALHVAVRSLVVDEIVASKVIRVGATVPAGGTHGEFEIVADPIAVRYGSKRASDDYEIVIGFGQGSAQADADSPARSRRRARRR